MISPVRFCAVLLFVAASGAGVVATADDASQSASPSPQASDSHLPPDARQQALAARDALFARLSVRLMEVMQAHGPVDAIAVCSQESEQIAKQVGDEHGVQIGRTSFHLRNARNTPPDWAQWFVANRVAAEQYLNLPDGKTGALLPIRLQEKCLICHGPTDQIAPAIQARLKEVYPDDRATGFQTGDLRGWFWVIVPASGDHSPHAHGEEAGEPLPQAAGPGRAGPPFGRGMGRGFGRGAGPGGADHREDMQTIHSMFADRNKIRRTVRKLPDGAEAITESDDPQIAALIQKHVPAMEGRVGEDRPLPPMTFHPVFVNLIKHSEDYTFNYEETDKGVKVTYTADDPFVIMLVQEHAQLVSRFLKNGMEEIHNPYELPTVPASPTAQD